jgi:hypothetical protein
MSPTHPRYQSPLPPSGPATYDPVCTACGGRATTLVNYVARDHGRAQTPTRWTCGCGANGLLSDTVNHPTNRYDRSIA